MNTEGEIEHLKVEITRLGAPNAEGKTSVKFGKLVRDERVENIFEALVGTLRAAKRKKVVAYDSEMLLQGVHDDVDIILLTGP
ncbi:costars family protein abracl [Phaffia rhodozyma]|uniref:Costars family protein abracl n=1 Tax=Phaffia rhodozyma TaxID=264483 RepID=A0A0F7SQG3_PHARH|nr:costars family protein abracl [Phaffia rhodozyma]